MEHWKIAILGDGGVGKTALAVKFIFNRFVHCMNNRGQQTYDPTIEDAYRQRFAVDNRMVTVEILDTAGQDEFAPIMAQQINVTSRFSFTRIGSFYREILRLKGKDVPIIMVANKEDIAAERQVPIHDGTTMAESMKCTFFETSAMTGYNVEPVFAEVVRSLRINAAYQASCQPKRPKHAKLKRVFSALKCIIM
ncbi:hypothetical protein VNI00_004675 [Paramarasmius palmivorus]|uniref:Uncharacterized protein n=1 Tax=Paramarasmius palmivorus TaxID=297713 RepID=A0AAW0DLG8_9AGAR